MLLADTVEYLMRETGRTRRQAQAALLQALKSGAVRSRGVLMVVDPVTGEEVEETGEPEDIPAEFYRNIPTEH